MVSDSVLKKIGIEKSLGFGFVQIWGILGDILVSKLLGFETFPFFRWFRFRYRKNLVSEKVSDSVSKKFGIEKKYRIRYWKNLVSEKSFGFGFVHILVIVTHWLSFPPLIQKMSIVHSFVTFPNSYDACYYFGKYPQNMVTY